MNSFWSFGFEIEGICFEKDYDSIKESLSVCSEFVCNDSVGYFITGDETISIDDELMDLACSEETTSEIIPVEFLVGPFEYTLNVKEKLIDLFLELAKKGLTSNDTCALHLHLKPKRYELFSSAAFWSSNLLLAYLVESKEYKRFLKYKNQPMFHSRWSSVENMIDEYKILEKVFSEKKESCFDRKITKYSMRGLCHAHESGTLEWRGIRNMFSGNPVTYQNKQSPAYLKTIEEQLNFVFQFFDIAELAHTEKNQSYILHSRLLDLKNVFDNNYRRR